MAHPCVVGIWDSYDEAAQHVCNQAKNLQSAKALKLRFSPNPAFVNLMDSRYTHWTEVCTRALDSYGFDSEDLGSSIVLNSLLKIAK